MKTIPDSVVASSDIELQPLLTDPQFAELGFDGGYSNARWLVLSPDLVELCWEEMNPDAPTPSLAPLAAVMRQHSINRVYARVQNRETQPIVDAFMAPSDADAVLFAIQNAVQFTGSSLLRGWTSFSAE